MDDLATPVPAPPVIRTYLLAAEPMLELSSGEARSSPG